MSIRDLKSSVILLSYSLRKLVFMLVSVHGKGQSESIYYQNECVINSMGGPSSSPDSSVPDKIP